MAGRQGKSLKGVNELYDSSRRHVSAEKIQPLPENMKKKVNQILEAIPSKSKSEIAEVLQACNYDVQTALNQFIAGEMETQNEWVVQGKRKNKKKKPKKSTSNGPQLPSDEKNIPPAAAKVQNGLQGIELKIGQNPEKESNLQVSDSVTETILKVPVPAENIVGSPSSISPGPLSPTESITSSLPDSQAKPHNGNSINEKPTSRAQTSSGGEVIKKSSKDLQRSAVSIARFQSLLDKEADISTKMLAKTFQAIRAALDAREKVLETQLKSVIDEAKRLLQERYNNAASLQFKCNRVSSMTSEDASELRNEIKHFVGERRIDEDLGTTKRFISDELKMLETIENFGEVSPIKQYTCYKRKDAEATKPSATNPSTCNAKTSSLKTDETMAPSQSSHEGENKNGKNESQSPLSPSQLKEQAEIYTKLQLAVKEQQVWPPSAIGSKVVDKSTKGRDFGRKGSRNNAQISNSKSRQKQNNITKNYSKPSESIKAITHGQGKTPSNPLNTPSKSMKTLHDPKDHSESTENVLSAEHSNDDKTVCKDPMPVVTHTQMNGHSLPVDTEVSEDKAKENRESQTTVNHQPHRTRRRYFRKSQTNHDSCTFRTGKVNEHSNAVASGNSMENGSNVKIEGEKNGFVPLPQRQHRPRKYYMKKELGSKIKFPPQRESESVTV